MGAVLALLTWVVALAALVVVGLLPLVVTRRGEISAASLRCAMWLGLAILVPAAVLAGEWLPLRSPGAALVVSVPVVAGIVMLVVRRPRWSLRAACLVRGPALAVLLAVAAIAVYLAIAAMGRVTNYDSGLYHLGAISYAGDHPALRGLANVYLALGYGNSHVALSAFAGNGPWDGEGYRLVNGLLLLLMAADLVLRLAARRRTAGTFVLMVAVPAVMVPMLVLADYWVTSPTSDTAVLVLGLVGTAYLADALGGSRDAPRDFAVALAASIVAVTMRPTMLVYAGAVVIVIVVLLTRRRLRAGLSLLWCVAGIGVVAGLLQALRDRRLSGWLGYPLGLLPFDVPWRAVDPSANRLATLGAARDPAHWQEASSGWGWIPAWVTRLPSQWETWELALLTVAAIVALAITWRRLGRPAVRLRALAVTAAPAALAVVTWFLLLPPSFRFIWGPIFALPCTVLGWSLWRLDRGTGAGRALSSRLPVGVGILLVLLAALCGATRLHPGEQESRYFVLGPLRVPYSVSVLPTPPTRTVVSEGGVRVLMPVGTDQCWTVYPMCTPQLESSLRSRGPSLDDGFTP